MAGPEGPARARQFSANVPFDLIHRPLSDLFIVCNEQRLTEVATLFAFQG